ncbi:hypothetical protein FH972_012241 [Carpinus fangiana]|uniref:1-aminocyclopropane-1-carboxylate synthase n=1 Tax=Carpinus fangiana TaxID=176857 RepID=A0A5N6R428_9ROSI|nr:hypothetical protein FH972_012241 [Carpinus fangiana]
MYAATVFSRISEIIEEEKEMACNLDLIHIVYSLSKDMGFPGFRVGIVYSYNDAVVQCCLKMSSFGLVSSQTQHLIASMLSDDAFVDSFIAESATRLERRYKIFTCPLAQPGWFKVCFANMDDSTMGVALNRIKTFVHQKKDVRNPIKRKCWNSNLRLSLKRVDDIMMAQSMRYAYETRLAEDSCSIYFITDQVDALLIDEAYKFY